MDAHFRPHDASHRNYGAQKFFSLLLHTFLSVFLLGGCTWNRADLSATEHFYKDNRAALDAAVADARGGVDYETMRKRYLKLAPEGFDCSTSPLVIEFTPIDFYYVLVFAESKDALKQSSAMKDEGAVKRRLGGGWYVVQRGFM